MRDHEPVEAIADLEAAVRCGRECRTAHIDLEQAHGADYATSNCMVQLDERLTVGIDIGGSKIAVALIDVRGAIVGRSTLVTEAALGFGRAVERMVDAIEHLAIEAAVRRERIAGIGIGCAGPVDPGRGLINNPYTLEGWEGCDIVSPMRERFGVPVVLENDADAAVFAEWRVGAAQGRDPVVMLTFGTGVGGGTVRGGAICRGAGGEHPELGHLLVEPEGAVCYCGSRGCLESVASGTAIGAAGKDWGLVSAREVFVAADRGHPDAAFIVERAVEASCRAAWTLCHTLLPGSLVLGGGMMEEHFDRFAGPIRERVRRATQFTPSYVSVVRAALGNDAGVVGAGMLAWEAVK